MKSIKKREHWFNLADAIIIVVCLALSLWAVLVYLAPAASDIESETVEASLRIDFPDGETLTHIAKGDAVFCGEKKIGTISNINTDIVNTVGINVTLEKNDDGIFLNGTPLWENGSFILETKLRSIEGTIYQITLREAE